LDQQYNRPWDDRMGVTRIDGYHPARERYGMSDLTQCCTEFNERLGIIGLVHKQSLEKGADLHAIKTYLTWGSFFYHCASNVQLQRVKRSSEIRFPACSTSLLTVPFLPPDPGKPDPNLFLDINGKAMKISPGLDTELPSKSSGIAGRITFKANVIDSVLKAKIVEFNHDPKEINQQYKPEFIPRPLKWFILYCEHDIESTAKNPGYQILCDMNPLIGDYASKMEENWPILQIEGKEHAFTIPAFEKEVRVPHDNSIFEELLEW